MKNMKSFLLLKKQGTFFSWFWSFFINKSMLLVFKKFWTYRWTVSSWNKNSRNEIFEEKSDWHSSSMSRSPQHCWIPSYNSREWMWPSANNRWSILSSAKEYIVFWKFSWIQFSSAICFRSNSSLSLLFSWSLTI